MNISKLHNLFLRSSGISTDSREEVKNRIFVALTGENFDGSNYIQDVCDRGALLSITENQYRKERNSNVEVVKSSLSTLQDLAHFHRQHLDIPVIAITGSNGKTTTKDLAALVLKQKFNLLATQGNFNNLLGLPLTLLNGTAQHELILLEMGTNSPGEIAKLCQISSPNIGLITNIGSAHLEGLTDVEGVLREKLSLYEFLNESGGQVLIPSYSDVLMKETEHIQDRICFYKWKTNLDDLTPQLKITSAVPNIQGELIFGPLRLPFSSHLIGQHNVQNIAAAISLGIQMSVDASEIVAAISAYKPKNNRSQIIERGDLTIYLDAYNANPVSMMMALDTLDLWPMKNKVVIAGDMKELGAHAHDAHSVLIDRLKGSQMQYFLVGDQMKEIDDSAYLTVEELGEYLALHPIIEENTIVLIKGSRGVGLEKILPFL